MGEITGIERAHGAAPSPDGRSIYVANESTNTVDVVDVAMLKVTKKVLLVGRPNNIAATPDGRKVYVAIAQSPGALQVIDTSSNEIIATISVHGGVHNTYVTPDGKYAVAGMVGARNITVVDTQTDMPVWTTYWDLGIRPMTFDTNPDGSTRRIYAQLSNFNGIGVLDFDTRKEVDRIEYPDVPADQRTPGHGGNTAHGIGVTPDNRYLVANSSLNSSVYVYSLPDLELVGGVRVGHSPNWVTITPDSRFAYISLSRNNSVAVLDIEAVKVVTEIKTGGQVPNRKAAGLVRRGISVSLSHNPMPDEAADNPDSAFEHVMADGFRVDTIQFNYHGYGVSHIDALCHFLHNGMLYNGVPARASTAAGCGKHGIQNLKNGIITRGVLLDIPRLRGVPYLEPGTAIYTEDIEAWLEQAGVTVSSGDAVFLRTGRWARRAELGPWQLSGNSAGIHTSVVRWIKERDAAFFGSDAATDVQPSLVDGIALPVHTLLIAGLGMNIFDNMDLEALADMAAAENRWEFMLTAGPIPVTGGTGSPLNAIAVF